MKHPLNARYLKVRNPSYWNSVWVTLRLVVLFAPFTLISSLKPAIKSLFALLGVFIAGISRWVGVQLMYLLYGLCGFIIIDDSDDSEET